MEKEPIIKYEPATKTELIIKFLKKTIKIVWCLTKFIFIVAIKVAARDKTHRSTLQEIWCGEKIPFSDKYRIK